MGEVCAFLASQKLKFHSISDGFRRHPQTYLFLLFFSPEIYYTV